MANNLIKSYEQTVASTNKLFNYSGQSSSFAPSMYMNSALFNRNSFFNSIITRIAIDVSATDLKHIKVDKETGLQTAIDSSLIDVLTYSANVDQTGRSLIYDLVWSMLDDGVVALVPTDTSSNVYGSTTFEVYKARVGRILQWYPQHVRVDVYNELTGNKENVIIEKSKVCIIESPFNGVLKDTNQTLRLLEQKMKVMESQDGLLSANRLNGFIQFPYAAKTELQKKQFDDRIQEITRDVNSSSVGLSWLGNNEKFVATGQIQASGLLDEVLRLQQDFFNQMGVTKNILNGTANETELNLYYSRTVDVIAQAIVDGINRIFVSKTARSQGQKIVYYRDPFKTIPVKDIATSLDLLVRNALISANEARAIIGKDPVLDANADKLYNPNIADANQMGGIDSVGQEDPYTDENYEDDTSGGDNYFE